MKRMFVAACAVLVTMFAATPAVACKPAHNFSCVSLNQPKVVVLEGNARYLQVSGRQDCSAGWEYNAATVVDGDGNLVKYSTVLPASDGKYAHGEYFIPVPRDVNQLTVTVEGFTGDGFAGTATRTINIKSLPAVSTTLTKPVVVTIGGEKFLQVSGTTTGYGKGAVNLLNVVDKDTGVPTVNGESGVKTDSRGRFVHGKVYVPVVDNHTYLVHVKTFNNIPEVSTDVVEVHV